MIYLRLFALLLFAAPFAVAVPAARAADTSLLAPPDGTDIRRDLPYVKDATPRQTLDLYLPPADKDKPDADRPLIIWIHGGGWTQGDKENPPATFFLRRGYAVASIGYRLSQDATWPAQIQDCRAAVRYLKATAKENHIDPNRVGVWGASAGGHLALLLGMAPDHAAWDADETEHAEVSPSVQCVLDWFGPTDLDEYITLDPKPDNLVVKLLGKPDHDLAKSASPINYVTRKAAPVFIMHGDKDPLVPIDQSRRLDAALHKAGADSTFITVPGAGHGGSEFLRTRYALRAFLFFDRWLAKQPAGNDKTR